MSNLEASLIDAIAQTKSELEGIRKELCGDIATCCEEDELHELAFELRKQLRKQEVMLRMCK